jgi:hypothetical protein
MTNDVKSADEKLVKKKTEYMFHLFFKTKSGDTETVEHVCAKKKVELFEKLNAFHEPEIIGLVKGFMFPVKQKVQYKI